MPWFRPVSFDLFPLRSPLRPLPTPAWSAFFSCSWSTTGPVFVRWGTSQAPPSPTHKAPRTSDYLHDAVQQDDPLLDGLQAVGAGLPGRAAGTWGERGAQFRARDRSGPSSEVPQYKRRLGIQSLYSLRYDLNGISGWRTSDCTPCNHKMAVKPSLQWQT